MPFDPFYLFAVPMVVWQLLLIRKLVRELRTDKLRWQKQKAEWAAQDARFAEKERELGIHI